MYEVSIIPDAVITSLSGSFNDVEVISFLTFSRDSTARSRNLISRAHRNRQCGPLRN
jgi:hypothetical protein